MKVVLRGQCLKTMWGVRAVLLRDMADLEARLRAVEIQASSQPEKWTEHGKLQKDLDRVGCSWGGGGGLGVSKII